MLRFLTAGESHGKALVAILEGCPSNLPVLISEIDHELKRRQGGYGRGGRMKIENDKVQILSGLRFGRTLGSPISLLIENKDWINWVEKMDPQTDNRSLVEKVTQLRPGHADLAGAIKYNFDDVRNVLERASARETAARVAIGAICKKLLSFFDVHIESTVLEIGGAIEEKGWKIKIDQAKEFGDTVGGIFEVKATGVPMGLGSYVHFDRRLDGLLAQAMMSIPAIKAVEIGEGFKSARLTGSKVHDPIHYKNSKFVRDSNHAGGLEGGVSNGEPIVVRSAMKPIATLLKPLDSVDLKSKKAAPAHIERSDICAVEAAAVVGEAMMAYTLANSFLEKFGGDSIEEIKLRVKK